MHDKCYLCGNLIDADRSVDHLPPKQFYAPSLRIALNLNKLLTLPAHGICNKAFESDEEYFTWSLVPLAMGSPAADELVRHHAAKFKAGRSQGLGTTVRKEFEPRPSGLYLPDGLVVKRVQGVRIARVAWKLVRGLYFSETNAFLPDDTPRTSELVEPIRAPTEIGKNLLWETVKAQPGKGPYGGVFEYKYFRGEVDGKYLHCWGILLWDRLMWFIAHHQPKGQEDSHPAA